MTTTEIEHPRVASRDEWLVARKELLAKEKALTRQRDALAGLSTISKNFYRDSYVFVTISWPCERPGVVYDGSYTTLREEIL